MSKKKQIILVIITLICIFLIMAVLSFKDVDNRIKKEAETLKKANQEVINNAFKNVGKFKEIKSINENDYIFGNIEAPVQIIVYSNFECPFCNRFFNVMEEVKSEFGDKVVFSFRHFYLSSHNSALLGAIASECAGKQEKFWEMHNSIFNRSENIGISENGLKKYAENLKLSKDKFNKCLDEEKYKDKIFSQLEEAENIGVIGTPTIFVNKEMFDGAYPFEDFVNQDGENVKGMKNIIKRHLKLQ